jgi:hypothetical protein
LGAIFPFGLGARRRVGRLEDFDLVGGSYSTDAKRFTLTSTGFAPVTGDDRPVTHVAALAFAGGVSGRYMQPAASYPVALPLDNVAAPHTSSDVLYFTQTVGGDAIQYPGDHSLASAFQGLGKGVRFVRSAGSAGRFRAVNAKLTGLVAGDVVRLHGLCEIETTTAGSIGFRHNGGLSNSVAFTHDAAGKVTGNTSVWSTARAGQEARPYLINGKQLNYVWWDVVATGTGDVDPTFEFVGTTGCTAVIFSSLHMQINPVDAPCDVPVTQAGDYDADEVDAGITSQIGFVLHGADTSRSIAPGGVISPPSVSVGIGYSPIVTRIEVINSATETGDRSGVLDNPNLDYYCRAWQNPAALNLPYGPTRIQRNAIIANISNSQVGDVTITSVFQNRIDKRAIIGNTATSHVYVSGNLTLRGLILLAHGDPTVSEYYQQTSIRATSNRTWIWAAIGGVREEDCLVIGSSLWFTRARHEVQFDEGTQGKVWVGENGIQTSGGPANAGGVLSMDGTRTHRLARSQMSGIDDETNVSFSYNDFCVTEPWMDGIYLQRGIVSRWDRARVVILKHTARMDTTFVQSERPIQITKTGAAGWGALDLATDPIKTLPHGINAVKIGTWDFDTNTFSSAPDAGRVVPIRFYYAPSLSGKKRTNPGFQFIISQMNMITHNQFPSSGEVFRWVDPDDSDFQLEFTMQKGSFEEDPENPGELIYVRTGSGVLPVLQVTESPDGEQPNRFGLTCIGALGNYDMSGWFMVSRGTMMFHTGGSWNTASAPPRNEPPPTGGKYDNFRVLNCFYAADRKQDFGAWDWSAQDPARCLWQNLFAAQAANGYTISDGSGGTLNGGTAGYYQELTIDNVTVLTGRTNPITLQGEATIIGAGNLVPARVRSNFNEFAPLPEGSNAPLYFDPEWYDEEQGCMRMPLTLEEAWDVRVSDWAIEEEGWDINAMIVTAIGNHRRHDPVIAQIEAQFHKPLPDRVVEVVNNAAIGTVLATGLTGTFVRYQSGNDRQGLYEIVGGAMRIARSLANLNQIDILTTNTGELIIVDIIVPDAVAPEFTTLPTVTGIPQNSQTQTINYVLSGFPVPGVTIRALVRRESGFVEVASFAGGASSATYTLDAGVLGTTDGDEISFSVDASNSAGSVSETVGIVFEEAETPPPSTAEEDLIALLDAAGGKNAYFRMNEGALLSGVMTFADLTGNGNTMTQATTAQQPAISAAGATFDGTNDNAVMTIAGGLFTVVMSFAKTPASTSGVMLGRGASTTIAQYSSGSATTTDPSDVFVNGTERASRGAFYTALQNDPAVKQLVSIRNADTVAETILRLGRTTGGLAGVVTRVAVLEHSTFADAGAIAAARALAEAAVME